MAEEMTGCHFLDGLSSQPSYQQHRDPSATEHMMVRASLTSWHPHRQTLTPPTMVHPLPNNHYSHCQSHDTTSTGRRKPDGPSASPSTLVPDLRFQFFYYQHPFQSP
ncbi:hypothetical protein HAX54_017976, partial [Datura stramonium]|nr:hypothetical protein [Datura stramonium]